MRYNIASLLALLLIAGMAVPAHAAGPCSLARAAGNWSFTDSGTVVNVGPRTAVGTLTFDALGNVLNGVGTSSLNGTIANETFSGTYTVNPDCTGTVNVTIYSGDVELFVITGNSVFDQNMQHMRMLFTSVVSPTLGALQTVIGLDGNKQ